MKNHTSLEVSFKIVNGKITTDVLDLQVTTKPNLWTGRTIISRVSKHICTTMWQKVFANFLIGCGTYHSQDNFKVEFVFEHWQKVPKLCSMATNRMTKLESLRKNNILLVLLQFLNHFCLMDKAGLMVQMLVTKSPSKPLFPK